MHVNAEGRLPVKLWADEVEDGAMAQIRNLANLPFAFRHIAIMPDCHQGYGMPIGGVLATEGVVVPNAVGVDIGCGMRAIQTNIPVSEVTTGTVKDLLGKIREAIPVGFNHRAEPCPAIDMPMLRDDMPICTREFESARRQKGTLGGGNHFIELQADQDGMLWVMIHSGSRNLGKQVADYYNKQAVAVNGAYHSSVPKAWELAFLPFSDGESDRYLREMDYCVEFALENRAMMMAEVRRVLGERFPGFLPEPDLDVAHNYAQMENHFGKNVMVHRKGATSARLGEVGIIPGSQGTASYIVRGLGNRESFCSCSHGAGRRMGRKEASRTLDLEAEIKRLDDQGIVHGIRTVADLDEAAGAYKDIDEVMAQQTDLVEIVHKLVPIGVVKG
jgi:tRNA-splicing ligase RtcB